MPSHRVPRVAEAIREVVSATILFNVADPRVRGITVLRVEVTGDLRHATVFVSAMGTESEQALALRGLKHASGFLQARVANRLQTRYTPILTFKLDDSVKKSIEISRLIDEALASDRKGKPEPEAEAEAGSIATPPADGDDLDDEDDDDDDDEIDEIDAEPRRGG